MQTTKWFLCLSCDDPDQMWSDMNEIIVGSEEDIKRAFETAVVDAEYPNIFMGPIVEQATAK